MSSEGHPPVGVEMLDVGNGNFSHFHETDGSHFHGTCWKWQNSRSGHFQMSKPISIKVSIANISGGA